MAVLYTYMYMYTYDLLENFIYVCTVQHIQTLHGQQSLQMFTLYKCIVEKECSDSCLGQLLYSFVLVHMYC